MKDGQDAGKRIGLATKVTGGAGGGVRVRPDAGARSENARKATGETKQEALIKRVVGTGTGQEAGAKRIRRPSHKLLAGLTLLMFSFAAYGLGLHVSDAVRHWQEERIIRLTLKAVHARQSAHLRASRTYAPSFDVLGVTIPDGCRASLFVGTMDKRPGYIAELCSGELCWAIDRMGELRVRQEADSSAADSRWQPLALAKSDIVKSNDFMQIDSETLGPIEQWRGSAKDGIKEAMNVSENSRKGGGPDAMLQGVAEPGTSPVRVVVVPSAPPEAFGLPSDKELPPLSPTRDSPALWGAIEEAKK